MILNKKYRSFILMLIFSSLIFGQENVIIKGSIKTSKGKPVNKANVVVIDTKIGTTSNKKGEFQFEIESNADVQITHAIEIEYLAEIAIEAGAAAEVGDVFEAT